MTLKISIAQIYLNIILISGRVTCSEINTIVTGAIIHFSV